MSSQVGHVGRPVVPRLAPAANPTRSRQAGRRRWSGLPTGQPQGRRLSTVGAPIAMGPPTCGTKPVNAGQTTGSVTLAAGKDIAKLF